MGRVTKEQSPKGFTLIELLVVIAIIGMLSSIVLSSLNAARLRSRDADRISTVSQIQLALELYYDANGQYPGSGGASSPNGSWSSSIDSSWDAFETALNPYLPSGLRDDPNQSESGWPGNGSQGYAYYTANSSGCPEGQWYMIVWRPEISQIESPGATRCGLGMYNYSGTVTTGSHPGS